MIKSLVLFLIFFLYENFSFSQFPYSSKSKKAIKLFEKARSAPMENINPESNIPDFKLGIEFANKAIEKDSNFWEAHVLAAELNEKNRDLEKAIFHYKKALIIHPTHSISSKTNFFLATCELKIGLYTDALKNIELFIRNPNAVEEWMSKAREMEANARFAIIALKNPIPFDPINLGEGINSIYPEYYPSITVDGKTMLFTRRLPINNASQFQEDFFVSESNEDENWKKAIPMPTNVNTINNEGAPTISSDGKSLIFVACSDETGDYGFDRFGYGSCDLFYSKKLGNKWLNPINLPGNVNSYNWETQPSLSADGNTLYFIRGVRNKNGKKDSDIYFSKLQNDGKWSAAERLPNTINTPYAEESVHIHPDGKTLYFASRGHVGMGGSDLFVSRMDKKGNWSKAVNLGYPINTLFDENSLMVSAKGDIAFLASNRPGGYGDLDIYYFNLPDEIKPTKTFYFDGLVFDLKTRKALAGHFQLIDIESGQVVIISDADKIDGSFMVALPINRDYAISVSYPGYFPYSLNFNLSMPDGQENYHLDIPLNPETSEVENVLSNVFFDLNQSKIRETSKIELLEFVAYLKQNPQHKIELGGHTDSRGNRTDNLILSSERAKSVFDFLISNGINANRLSYKGYGSTQTIISDVEIEKMNSEQEKEKAHQKNRRTVYKIIL